MAVQSFLVRSAPCGGGGMYLIFAPVLRVKGVEMLKAFKLDSRLHVLIFALGFGVMLAVVAIGALWLLQDPVVFWAAVRIDTWVALSIGVSVSYGFGLKVLELNLATQKLDRLASYDFLTGSMTRARFFRQIIEQPSLEGGFLIFDMDDFKEINDTLGHAAGDAALVKIAAVARANLGPEDCICRLGGDEFLVFFKGLDRFHVHDRARSIAMTIMEQKVTDGQREIYLSASFGISVLNAGDDIDYAIGIADADLYRAKSIHRRSVPLQQELPLAS